jgi:hypothetical protein
MNKPTPSYQGHRLPSEIISYAIWLYHRFSHGQTNSRSGVEMQENSTAQLPETG